MSNLLKILGIGVTACVVVCFATSCMDSDSSNSDSSDNQQTEYPEIPVTADISDIVSSQTWEAKGEVYNIEAPIPPQCYTKTEGTFNPCMTCHQTYMDGRPNQMADAYLQGDYDYSEIGFKNHWKNLFVDRRRAVDAIPDEFIEQYIAEDNYQALTAQLSEDNYWQQLLVSNYGKAAEAFDEYGFAKDGSQWVAFNYKPLPSTFWPTNGSTDDVLIRLPQKFRQSTQNVDSKDAYIANLGLVEITIQGLEETTVPEIDETLIGQDVDGNGVLEKTNKVVKSETYYGAAADEEVHYMLYPTGTEFLHSVRYVGVNANGDIYPATRMKELRYMKKTYFIDKPTLKSVYDGEKQEKIDENPPVYTNYQEKGLYNGFGWMILGFIEDAEGALRQQTAEENKFCMGCHTSIGATIDQTFAFPRKVTGEAGWKYINYKGMKDVPNVGAEKGEIMDYLIKVGGGDEFRENDEMLAKWFDEEGKVNEALVAEKDVYELITPSRERALKLNKAYYLIVKDQSFIFGRDATVQPVQNVYSEVSGDEPPLAEENRYTWDIRLNWQSQ